MHSFLCHWRIILGLNKSENGFNTWGKFISGRECAPTEQQNYLEMSLAHAEKHLLLSHNGYHRKSVVGMKRNTESATRTERDRLTQKHGVTVTLHWLANLLRLLPSLTFCLYWANNFECGYSSILITLTFNRKKVSFPAAEQPVSVHCSLPMPIRTCF